VREQFGPKSCAHKLIRRLHRGLTKHLVALEMLVRVAPPEEAILQDKTTGDECREPKHEEEIVLLHPSD